MRQRINCILMSLFFLFVNSTFRYVSSCFPHKCDICFVCKPAYTVQFTSEPVGASDLFALNVVSISNGRERHIARSMHNFFCFGKVVVCVFPKLPVPNG